MEILHTINLADSKTKFINVDLSDSTIRNSLVLKTPTTTLPFLETDSGNISQSPAIEYYLCSKYKPELLGNSPFEKAKVNQWIEFASCEINRCAKSIIYPIFGWAPFCKEQADKENGNLKKYLKIMEENLKKNNYIVGNKMTLADILLFRYLRFFMMLHFPENVRSGLCPKVTKWFENIMNTPEAIEAYGRTILCKKPIKPLNIKIDKTKTLELLKRKVGIKEPNPLDSLPPSSFNLEQFKNEYMAEKDDKNKIMEKFWEEFDPKGYSLWWMEYQNLDTEGKKLFRMNNSKNFFLERIDEDFCNYAFGIHGVYGKEGDYKVRGVWVWRGNGIPKEIKDNEYFEYMTIKKLNSKNDNDKQIVNDYWTKINKGENVDGRKLAEFSYFH